MKLGPVTKFDKKNKTLSKRFDDDVMSANRDAIDIFPIYGQFGAIWMPDPGRTLCKININSNLYLAKTENRTKRIPNAALTLLL